MSETLSERRMGENEVVFREHNERASKSFDELKKIAKEEGQEKYIVEDDTPLLFYCECADEDCRKRVKLKPSRYNEIHKQRDRFVVICGHEAERIERVIGKETGFCIIEKFIKPPESATNLNKTEVDNS